MVNPFTFPGLRVVEVTEKQIQQAGGRLDAGCFFSGRSSLNNLPARSLGGVSALVSVVHPPRQKQQFVDTNGIPFFQPSQICDIDPIPTKLLSKASIPSHLRVSKNQILLTRSGTIGNASFVGETLDKCVFSDDLLRLNTTDSSPVGPGYIYAFLKSKRGKQAVVSHSYGAVIQHIEPGHLESVDVPIADPSIADPINESILKSFDLRDESNDLMALARKKLLESLGLPTIDELRKKRAGEFSQNIGVVNFEVSLGDRMDASHYVPISTVIEQLLPKHAPEVSTIGDARISSKIILPGQFKRIYVEKEFGVPFFSGKDIGELTPSDMKYISSHCHSDRIDELTVHENMVLVTCSGTIGNTAMVLKHWHGWTMTHDIIRIVCNDKRIAGYLYAWLSTEYGRALVSKYSYGAVVPHIEDHHLSQVHIPLLAEHEIREIGALVLDANEKRHQAFLLEEQAIKDFDAKVWGD